MSAKEAIVGVMADEREERMAKTCVGKADMSGIRDDGRMGASIAGGRCAHGSELGIVRSDMAVSVLQKSVLKLAFLLCTKEKKLYDRYVLVGIASKRLSNVFERNARETRVEARHSVACGLGEAGTRQAARDVQLLLYGVCVVCRREVEGLGDDGMAGGDLEHVECRMGHLSGRAGYYRRKILGPV